MDKPVPAPTSSQSATQRAYLALRNDIIFGRIAPGERLKIDTLKENLDTGASPVREALSLLTSDQLVDRIDQRGFRVATASRDQFREILGLRCHLEVLAVRDSIAKGADAWEEALVLAHHYMLRAKQKEQETFEECHKAFHMALISGCNSPILLRFCNQLYDLNVRYRYLAGKSKGYNRRDVDAEHEAILNAAIDRDTETVCTRLVEHYENTGAFLAEQMS
jgi:DNA-binding GntR family transcriptional regulator